MLNRDFEIPSAFTALNGAAQTMTVTVHNSMDLINNDEDLALVLDILRSNGAQPIITEVTETTITFVVEQTWCYGSRGDRQVSAVAPRDWKVEAVADITDLFKNAKVKDAEGKATINNIFVSAAINGTIGSLVSNE